MSGAATMTARKMEHLARRAVLDQDENAATELREWAASHPDEAASAAHRSWKMQEFLQLQGMA